MATSLGFFLMWAVVRPLLRFLLYLLTCFALLMTILLPLQLHARPHLTLRITEDPG